MPSTLSLWIQAPPLSESLYCMDGITELPCLLGFWVSLAKRQPTQEIRKKQRIRWGNSLGYLFGLCLSNKSHTSHGMPSLNSYFCELHPLAHSDLGLVKLLQ